MADAALILLLLLVVIDWRQTLTIATERNDDGSFRWHELNPLLGRHPSRGRVHAHFGIGAVLLALLAYLLPVEYRQTFLVAACAIEGLIVARNHVIGIRV